MIFARAHPRLVNIKAAIDRSSFQIPVFIAITSDDSEDHIFRTFATARDVFGHIFSLMLNRLRQLHAVETVERLVPISARLRGSVDTEYVLVVQGRAVFWFSAAAARRAAGRRLLLEHARELANAEQSPLYKLDTKTKLTKVLAVLSGVGVIAGGTLVVGHFVTQWTRDRDQAATVLAARVGNAATGIAGPRATADRFFAARQLRSPAALPDDPLSVTSDVRDSALSQSSPADEPPSRRRATGSGQPVARFGGWTLPSAPVSRPSDAMQAGGSSAPGALASPELRKRTG